MIYTGTEHTERYRKKELAMHIETERKFLVRDDSYKKMETECHRLTQGYICREKGRTVRVRLWDDRAYLTIKGAGSASGMSRYEWEKEISAEDAADLFRLCREGFIDKTRHIVPYGGKIFEVDEFHGENSGLTVAEIELGSEDETFSRPPWLGKEVTGDRRYYNSMLVISPYSDWASE